MTLIVNLSTIHHYSISTTIGAFVSLCNEYSHGCLETMPRFFQTATNYSWVTAQYYASYNSLIKPYRLGKITTEYFLEKLSEIFNFMRDLEKGERHKLLAEAWNASISMADETHGRLLKLVETAKQEPVYLISNTNELNVEGILALFKNHYPQLKFNSYDISMRDDPNPVEILPNVFLCLSYRYGSFKVDKSTMGLLETLKKNISDEITLVSQFEGDRKKAEELGIANIYSPEGYFHFPTLTSVLKKNL